MIGCLESFVLFVFMWCDLILLFFLGVFMMGMFVLGEFVFVWFVMVRIFRFGVGGFLYCFL